MALPIGFVRCLLFIFNIVFALSGVAILSMSAVIYQDVKEYSAVGDFLEARFHGPLIALMVIGSLVILVAVMGVYGTIKLNQRLLIAFAVMLFAIYVAEVVVATIAFLRSDDIETGIKDNMAVSLSKYKSDPIMYRTFNSMQQDLKCCGVTGPQDYIFVFLNNSVPASCCYKNTVDQMCKQSVMNHVIHQEGCYDALKHFVTRSAVTLGSVTISLAFIEIVGIVLAVFLVISLQKVEKHLTAFNDHQSRNPILKYGRVVPSGPMEDDFGDPVTPSPTSKTRKPGGGGGHDVIRVVPSTTPKAQANYQPITPPETSGNYVPRTPPETSGNYVPRTPPERYGNYVPRTPPERYGNDGEDVVDKGPVVQPMRETYPAVIQSMPHDYADRLVRDGSVVQSMPGVDLGDEEEMDGAEILSRIPLRT